MKNGILGGKVEAENEKSYNRHRTLAGGSSPVWRVGVIGSLIGILVLLLVACGSPDPTPTAAPTPTPVGPTDPVDEREDWEIEWEETLAAAQAEGHLSLAGGGEITRGFAPILAEFERQFGIEMTISSGSGGAQAERIRAEAAAGVHAVDVLMAGITNGEMLIAEGLLAPPAEDFILPEVKDESLWFQGRHHYGDVEEGKYIFLFSASPRGSGLLVNTDLVDPYSITSLWDITEPQYHGLIVSGFLGTEGQAGAAAEWYGAPGLGPEWLRTLVLETGIEMVDDTHMAKDWVITGRKAIAIFVGSTDDMYELREAGAPIEIMDYRFPMAEGDVLAGGGSASMYMILANSPNPNARKIFTNWWLGKEGQLLIHHEYQQRQSFRLDIPNDMLRPEARFQPDIDYIYPQSDPHYQAIRGEALEFIRGLTDQWRAMQ